MDILELLREIRRTTWAHKLSAVVTAIVVAATCFTVCATVGRSAASLARVTEQMDHAGARRLSVVDTRLQGAINAQTVGMMGETRGIDTAYGLGTPFDSTNGALGVGGPKVPTWPLIGQVNNAVSLVAGRVPTAGEAIVSAQTIKTLGLAAPVGFLVDTTTSRQYSIVGVYRASEAFPDLGEGALVVQEAPIMGREVRVTMARMADAPQTLTLVMSILSFASSEGVHIESPLQTAATARRLQDELSQTGAQTLTMALSAGGLLVAVVTLSDVLVRRRELGRRRTLGIRRSQLVALVIGGAVLAALIGAVVGSLAGIGWGMARREPAPALFVVSTAYLTIVVAAIAASLPAVYAATRDPVVVMRTP